MQKVAAFKTEDGSLHESVTAAHDHEIKQRVLELCEAQGESKALADHIAIFAAQHKDKLLTILEKPKL